MTATQLSRAEAIAIIRALPARLVEEIQYRIDTYNDEPEGYRDGTTLDMVDGLIDVAQLAEDWAGQDDDKLARKQSRDDLRHYNRVFVRLGMYVPIADDVARESCRCGIGVHMAHFPVIDGQRYDSVMSYSGLNASLV